MVEERQCSLNEGNVRILRDIDDLKVSAKINVHKKLKAKNSISVVDPSNAVATGAKGD